MPFVPLHHIFILVAFPTICVGHPYAAAETNPSSVDSSRSHSRALNSESAHANIRLPLSLTLNTSQSSHILSDETNGPGHHALEVARRAAAFVPSDHPLGEMSSESSNTRLIDTIHGNLNQRHNTIVSGNSNGVASSILAAGNHDTVPSGEESRPALSCDSMICKNLFTTFLETVEGAQCRSIFKTGKCPTTCVTALAVVTSNESWLACKFACSETDIVASGADRWSRLCGARTESFIDQGKEAVKSLVSDGLASQVHVKAFLQFLVGVLILVLGVGYGYRRGAISAQLAYRMQKRCLIGRKNSDASISV